MFVQVFLIVSSHTIRIPPSSKFGSAISFDKTDVETIRDNYINMDVCYRIVQEMTAPKGRVP